MRPSLPCSRPAGLAAKAVAALSFFGLGIASSCGSIGSTLAVMQVFLCREVGSNPTPSATPCIKGWK